MKDKIIKIISILLAICIFFCVSAPELSAASETENSSARVHSKIERNVGNFTGLVSSGSIAVTYIQSDITKVVIEGDPQFFDFLETKVSLGQLYIRITKSSYRSLNLSVTVYSPTLDSIASSGSGTVYDVEGHVSSGNISYHNTGSGKIEIGDIKCKSFKCSTSGSGKVLIGSLHCENASLTTSGSGGITIEYLMALRDADLRLSGSGFGLLDNINVNGDLTLSTSGSGSIKVNGNTGSVNASTSGSGSIIGSLKYERISIRTSGSGNIRF